MVLYQRTKEQNITFPAKVLINFDVEENVKMFPGREEIFLLGS